MTEEERDKALKAAFQTGAGRVIPFLKSFIKRSDLYGTYKLSVWKAPGNSWEYQYNLQAPRPG
jgi:hypothetical protein